MVEAATGSLHGLGDTATVLVLSLVGIFYVPLWCLEAFLVSFHCLLCYKHITTYEYLTGKKPRPAGPPPGKAQPSSSSDPPAKEIPKLLSRRSMSVTMSLGLKRSVSEFSEFWMGETVSSPPGNPSEPWTMRELAMLQEFDAPVQPAECDPSVAGSWKSRQPHDAIESSYVVGEELPLPFLRCNGKPICVAKRKPPRRDRA
eukprot:gnl/TRDRNA2_/TRDRNA2_165959_c0_seq1.p1 gnl/TRDRNA2_/TRDRNA2_165959_c0~~gnl/TRDRNA2_/TRDRNA2_165959_c0_seq1.p1  ORF type:complete len:208 (+),score=32.44 gnl/TRDRNA2_/TRDRNA2_165959_c0_seq1:23-625(+)